MLVLMMEIRIVHSCLDLVIPSRLPLLEKKITPYEMLAPLGLVLSFITYGTTIYSGALVENSHLNYSGLLVIFFSIRKVLERI